MASAALAWAPAEPCGHTRARKLNAGSEEPDFRSTSRARRSRSGFSGRRSHARAWQRCGHRSVAREKNARNIIRLAGPRSLAYDDPRKNTVTARRKLRDSGWNAQMDTPRVADCEPRNGYWLGEPPTDPHGPGELAALSCFLRFRVGAWADYARA